MGRGIGLLGLLSSSLFIRTCVHLMDKQNDYLYMGTLFCFCNDAHCIFRDSFNNYALLCVLQTMRQLFFPTWAFGVPGWIAQILYSTIEVLLWACIVYFVVSLAPEAKRFSKYLALLLIMHQMAIGLLCTLGAIGRIMVIANIALLIFLHS